MIPLPSLRLLAGLALVAVLAFSHFIAYRKGQAHVRLQWQAAVSAANEEARGLERSRQRRADEAQQLAANREAGIRSAAAAVAGERDGLRDALRTARERGSQSLDACRVHAAALEAVFGQCAGRLEEVARDAASHASDSLKLQQSWPN